MIRRGLRRILFKRRMHHLLVLFPWRISDVSEFVRNFTVVCTGFQGVCATYETYVWRMKCTRDVSTAYVLRYILICGLSALYQLLFQTDVFTLFMQFAHYIYQL